MKTDIRSIISVIRPWACAFLLFVISYPKWFWGYGSMIIVGASYLLLLLALEDISKNQKSWIFGIVAIVFQTVIIGVTDIFQLSNDRIYLMVFVKSLGFGSLFLCSTVFWKKIADCFIKLLAILLVFALVEHLLISFFSISFKNPTEVYCPTNPDRGYYSYFFNVYLQTSFDYFNRFYAFYDEPGVLGNIVMVMLYIQRFDLKKWYNIILLVSGLLSFSFAFYIALAAYYIIIGKFGSKIVFIVLVIVATYYLYSNEYIYHYLFRRTEFEYGQLSGYNREAHGDFRYWIEGVSVSDYLFWGYQPRDNVPYAASWKWAFALYGIIPSILYLLVITIPRALNIRNISNIICALMIMLIIWIQRPFVYNYLYVFLILIPFIYFGDDYAKKKRIIKIKCSQGKMYRVRKRIIQTRIYQNKMEIL